MEKKTLSEALSRVGLNELEVQCYLELVKKSPQRASALARKLEIPKATLLLALSRLSDELTIVKRALKKNSFEFSVEDPKDLLSLLKRRKEEIDSQEKTFADLLPELRAMQNFDVSKPKISYVEGKEAMKQVFLQILEEAKEIIGYGSNEDDLKYLPKIYPEYYEKRVSRKIPVKAIIPATSFNLQETLKNEIRHQRQTHLIPKEFAYPIQVNIYGQTTIFFSFEENFALVIKSKPITGCLKKIFEFAFDYTTVLDKNIRTKQ
ncbi:MAG: helix-turn-helix domain-containing protein [Patescibacteria group bacterium]